jgi:hypothetical protein
MNLHVDAPPKFKLEATPADTKLADRWFDQWVTAKGEPLKHLVSSMLGGLAALERAARSRPRKRRPVDQVRYEAAVEVITCNLAYAVLNPPESGCIAIRRGKRWKQTRYDNRMLSPKVITLVLNQFADLPIVTQRVGSSRTGLSTIAPTDWFAERTHEREVSFADFGRNSLEEVVILSTKSKPLTGAGWKKYSIPVDYKDCEEADNSRAEVRALNRFLEDADITFLDDGQEPRVDPYQRTLTRRYTTLKRQRERFDQSGRVFGGFWMNLEKRRLKHIRIQGEPPVTLDFSNMFARLAYARLGLVAPSKDLYDLTGHLEGYEAQHRKGVKLAFSTLLFGGGSKLPPEVKDKLPPKATMAKVKAAIQALHPELTPLLGSHVGYELMFQESQILMEALGRLFSQGIVALGLHDAVMVPKTKETVARQIMGDASQKISGIRLPVG